MQNEKHMVQILASPCKDCYKNRKHAVIYSRGKNPQMEQRVQKSQYVVANTIYILEQCVLLHHHALFEHS